MKECNMNVDELIEQIAENEKRLLQRDTEEHHDSNSTNEDYERAMRGV